MEKQELISNNEKFIKSTYNGVSVIVDKNGYFNASKICMDNNKRFNNWRRSDQAKELLQAYNEFLQNQDEKCVRENAQAELPPIINKFTYYNNETRGFYIHKDLVNSICLWCNPSYHLIVNRIMNMLNEESRIRNITLEEKLKEMEENLEKYKTRIEILESEINKKSVKTDLDERTLRIYDITDYEESINKDEMFNPMDEDCIWWMSATEKPSMPNQFLLLEIVVVSAMHVRMDIKKYYNRTKVNNHLNTVKHSCKIDLYNHVMKNIKPKSIKVDKINL